MAPSGPLAPRGSVELSIPFNDLTEADAAVAAWLRFAREADGGIWGALFETSGQGDPLSFCFTRVDLRDPSLDDSVDAGASALTSLVKTLFQVAQRSPALVFCLAEELPPGVIETAVRPQMPFCRISPTAEPARANGGGSPATWTPAQLSWAVGQPSEGSLARHLLSELLERSEPWEPLRRAGEALAEAFADETVRAMVALPGLTTVVVLPSPPQHQEQQATQPPAGLQGEWRGLTLAERLWRALAAPVWSPGIAPDVRLDWPGALMPFQVEGVQALLSNDRLLLADDMGLGKTLQAIAALRILHARGESASCLVAAPASLLGQWRREIAKWAPELSAIIVQGNTADRAWQWAADRDVTLVSYETLRSDFGGNTQAPVRRRTWDVVIADEAQRIKNRNDTSNALKGLKRVRSWALTGTPIENHEEELASILEFVDHDGSGTPKHYLPGVELQARHRELQLRRKKAEVLDDLPPKQVSKLTIELNPTQRASYDNAVRDGTVHLKSLGADVRVQHVLELITRLKQICNADPKTGASSKLEDIKERLGALAAQGHKALVFSQYTNDISGVDAAVNFLQEFNALRFTGDMSHEERDAAIEKFKAHDEHKALVLSLRAGGLGLNLQEASYVFHLDRWWNPAVERQAEDRAHRMGQTAKVNVFKYSCADTIEARIDEILERKQGIFDQLVDDVSLDLSAQLSRDELFGLFNL